MKFVAVLSLCGATAFAAPSPKPPIAYSADLVVASKGTTSRSRVVSDGVHTATKGGDGKSGSFRDDEKKLQWVYGASFGCVQVPLKPAGATVTTSEEVVGSEKVDGRATTKVKVTSTIRDPKKSTTLVMFEWRATELGNLVVRRKSENDDFESRLEHIVTGKPDSKELTFPSPPCKVEPVVEAAKDAAEAPGGFRTVSFFDASCRQLVPLPLTMSIPSDYAIRSGGARGCFWGATDDLDRLLADRNKADFESIRRGVFWCRVSGSTQYDPDNGFTSEDGPQSQWTTAMKRIGARNVSVTSRKIGEIPSCRVTATVNGQHVYMLYLAVPGTDSPAVLINYHPPGKGNTADDDAAWQHFLDSIKGGVK